MTNEQFELLKKPFPPNAIQWRITATGKNSPKGLAVPYLDSRAIQNRLDEVIGRENWQNSFDMRMLMKDNAFVCTISIFDEKRGEWISKSNGAGSSDIEPIKGGFSDAFKRAASMWNIGRYLYEFEGVWVVMDERKAIAVSEFPKLEKVYNETVKRIFNNKKESVQPDKTVPPTQHVQPNNSVPPNSTFQPVAETPVYTVVSAVFNNTHTVVELTDGKNTVKMFFNGEAKLAKNQRITDAIINKRKSPTGDYWVLEAFRIADYSQAA